MPTTERSAWATLTVERLRRAGHRSGGARTAVVELLAEQRCCLTAQEIHDLLRERRTRVGIASVYRALDLLSSLRLVQRLDVGDGTARYEAALPGGDHHHHLVCERCGAVAPFADVGLEAAIDRVAASHSYRIDGHDVVLRGECPTCRSVTAATG